MVQLIFNDRIYIKGKPDEVLKQINELSKEFKLIKDILARFSCAAD